MKSLKKVLKGQGITLQTTGYQWDMVIYVWCVLFTTYIPIPKSDAK